MEKNIGEGFDLSVINAQDITRMDLTGSAAITDTINITKTNFQDSYSSSGQKALMWIRTR